VLVERMISMADLSEPLAGHAGVRAPVSVVLGHTSVELVVIGLVALGVIVQAARRVLQLRNTSCRLRWLSRGVAGVIALVRGQPAHQAMAERERTVEQLSDISRALSKTNAGISGLQKAVVEAAAAIAGRGAISLLLLRRGDALVACATHGIEGTVPRFTARDISDRLLAGHVVRVDQPPEGLSGGGMIAVPMVYRARVVGALAVISGEGYPSMQADVRSLTILANSAAIALVTMRNWEQERKTVMCLREQDAWKSRLLATVQQDVPPQLAAILGMATLLEEHWSVWDARAKLDAVGDIRSGMRAALEAVLDVSQRQPRSLELDWLFLSTDLTEEEVFHTNAPGHHQGEPVDASVILSAEPEVPAQHERLRQVSQALLDNVAKLAPEGTRVRVGGLTVTDDSTVRMDGSAVVVRADVLQRARFEHLNFVAPH